MIDSHFPRTIQWVRQWMDAEKRERDWLNIRFTTYEDFVSDKHRFLEELWSFFGIAIKPEELEIMIKKSDTEVQLGADWSNFRQGKVDEWRKVTTGVHQEKMLRAIPANMAEHFSWNP